MGNGRKVYCPLPEYSAKDEDGKQTSNYFVVLPEKWLVRHSLRRDEALEKAGGKLGDTDGIKFAISMAILDDWNLPGLGGNPENWNFEEFDLEIARWVNSIVYDSFAGCWYIKKKLLKL